MKKGEIYEGIIEKFDFPDKGTLVTESGKITVKHALPGQKVSVMITKKRGGRLEGKIVEVVEKSPLETAESRVSISAPAAAVFTRRSLMRSSWK